MCKFLYNLKNELDCLVLNGFAQDYQKAYRMDWLYTKGIPIEAQYLYRKGLEMSRQGKTEMAMKYLRQAVIIAPGYSKAIYEMGNCFAQLGRFTEAIERYDRSIQIDPFAPDPRVKKEEIISRKGNDH